MPKKSPFFINIGPNLSMMIGLPKIPSWNTKQRPKKTKKGTLGFNFQTNSLEYFDGADWFTAPMS